MKIQFTLLVAMGSAVSILAHDPPGKEFAVTNGVPLSMVTETSGPVPSPKGMTLAPGQAVSGQGFWKFVAARDLVPVPPDAMGKVRPAHGTIVVDKATDIVYWGLQGVGWVGFSNRLSASWIVAGNPAFTNGNLHGADILPRAGRPAQVAAADNLSGKIYLTDTTFQGVETLIKPTFGAYATNNNFKPTDVAFVGGKEMWVVDGYGQNWFMSADVSPFQWQGEIYGGVAFSRTLHGVTYDTVNSNLWFSARPEGNLKHLNSQSLLATIVMGLPPGHTLCDVDVWGDYALAACLDGPTQAPAPRAPGPLFVINLKKKAIVATIKPKEELGYADALHIHDAAWYVTGSGANQEVYILFTNWNPGGIGALKLVNVAD